MTAITEGLFALQDEGYRAFHARLIPDIPYERIIGVRTPDLRRYAKKVAKLPGAKAFLQELPHTYYEENNLHGALLNLLYPDDIDAFLAELERFCRMWTTGQPVICSRQKSSAGICRWCMTV